MFRVKAILGNTGSWRTFDNQSAELLLSCAALIELRSAVGVCMTHLGMPGSYVFNA
jgi:hypothetical protein